MSLPKENIELLQLCEYLSIQYKGVIFVCDQIGMKLPVQVAMRFAKMRTKGFPDLTILEPMGGYHGLCIEYKATGTEIKTKREGKYKNDHLQNQSEILTRLANKGYLTTFGLGFDYTKKVIDAYLFGYYQINKQNTLK